MVYPLDGKKVVLHQYVAQKAFQFAKAGMKTNKAFYKTPIQASVLLAPNDFVFLGLVAL